MVVNDFGIIASQEWEKLPEQFTNIALDVFQVMPNHIHGILLLKDAAPVGAGLAPARDNIIPTGEMRTGASHAPTKTITVGNIVGV